MKTRTNTYRSWNWKAAGLLAIPWAAIYGLQMVNYGTSILPFLIFLGISIWSVIEFIKRPWITKVVHEIFNYSDNEDGTTDVEWVDDEMKSGVKMKVKDNSKSPPGGNS